jgi:lysophospholipase L1-like esterase
VPPTTARTLTGTRRWPIALAVLAAVLAAPGTAGAIGVRSIGPPAENLGPAPSATSAPGLSVTPAGELTDGQQVEVAGSGFAPGAQVAVGECEAGATTAGGCSVAGALEAQADAAGAFSAAFTVAASISVGGTVVDCDLPGRCELGAGQLPSFTPFATVPITVAAAAASSQPTTGPFYLALGDSLSVGFGAPAGQGYVADLESFEAGRFPGLQLVDLGCAGETTTSFVDGALCPYQEGSQLAAAEAFLRGHRGEVAFVTIDIGGNDVTGCASATPPASVSASCVASATAAAAANLATIDAGLRAAAGAGVPIVGMTYYDPFLVEWLDGTAGQAAATASVAALDQFDAALAATYTGSGAAVADVAGAFFTDDFTDCATGSPPIVAVHANAAGYAAIAGAFEAVLAGAVATTAQAASGPELAFTGFALGPFLVAGGLLAASGLVGILLASRRRRAAGPG